MFDNLTKTEGGVIAVVVNHIPEPEPGTIRALPSDPGSGSGIWFTVAAITPPSALVKLTLKRQNLKPRMWVKNITRVEFKVTLCCLMTPIKMLVYSESI